MGALSEAPYFPRIATYSGIGVALAACAVVLAGGTLASFALAAIFALAVPLLYITFTRPLIFPYGLYVLLIPFDNILSVAQNVTATRLLGVAAGLTVLAWCVRTGKFMRPDRSGVALAALLLWILCTVFWSIDQKSSMSVLPTYAGLALLYFALGSMPLKRPDFEALLLVAVIGGCLAAVYGAFTFYHNPAILEQSFTAQRLFNDPNNEGPRIDSNHFANQLLLPCAALILAILRARSMLLKVLSGTGLAIIAVALLLSSSREAALAVTLILVYYAIRTRYRVELSFVLGGLVFICGNVSTSLWARFALGSQRSSIWSVGWEAFKHNWFSGTGIGTFIDAYDKYYLGVPQVYSNGWSSPPHNLVVHYSVELGALGMLLIAYFFFTQFRSLRFIRPNSDLYDYRVLMESALLALAFVSMFIDLFTYKYAWLTLAMAAQLRNVALQNGDSRAEPIHDSVATIRTLDEGAPAFAKLGASFSAQSTKIP